MPVEVVMSTTTNGLKQIVFPNSVIKSSHLSARSSISGLYSRSWATVRPCASANLLQLSPRLTV